MPIHLRYPQHPSQCIPCTPDVGGCSSVLPGISQKGLVLIRGMLHPQMRIMTIYPLPFTAGLGASAWILLGQVLGTVIEEAGCLSEL